MAGLLEGSSAPTQHNAETAAEVFTRHPGRVFLRTGFEAEHRQPARHAPRGRATAELMRRFYENMLNARL